MAFLTKTFDPGLIVVQFGPYSLTGYADGTFVKASRNEDTFKIYVGADGTPARSRTRNKSGKVEVTLSQTSPSNDMLASAHLADELLGAGVYPFTVKDLNGTTLVTASEAWVAKPADVEEGKEVSPRAWTIETGDIDVWAGGNVV